LGLGPNGRAVCGKPPRPIRRGAPPPLPSDHFSSSLFLSVRVCLSDPVVGILDTASPFLTVSGSCGELDPRWGCLPGKFESEERKERRAFDPTYEVYGLQVRAKGLLCYLPPQNHTHLS